MRTLAMRFSLVPLPQFRWHYLADSCWNNFHRLGVMRPSSSSFRALCSKSGLEGGYTRKAVNTKTGGGNRSLVTTPGTSTNSTSSRLVPEKTGLGRKLDISRTGAPDLALYQIEAAGAESDQYYIGLAETATVIVLDIETTGFSREKDRIVEFACRDLRGGENCTLQTLVNPEREVTNEGIHGISTRMVNRSDVPRMKDLIPILLAFIESRRIPGGIVMLVAHNGRSFDFPFLEREFRRCSYEFPEHWLFADTFPLARALTKSLGPEVVVKNTLQALRKYYKIELNGSAHRALSDVHTLAHVLRKLTIDLKKPLWKLIQECSNSK